MAKSFIIGDIHGAGQELQGLLDKIAPSTDDEIVSVGDIFDRGKHADLVWRLLKDKTVFMGNHEYKMLHWLRGRREWLPQHYYVALNILHGIGVSPDELVQWLEGLPWLRDYGDYMVVHGGVVLDSPLEPSLSMNIFYSEGRNLYSGIAVSDSLASDIPKQGIPKSGDNKAYWWDLYKGERLVIYGHLVTGDNYPRIRRNSAGRINSIGIDTAAVHGGCLTAYSPEEDRFYSYQSGVDWGEQVRADMKVASPVVNGDYMAFVRSEREKRHAEMASQAEMGKIVIN